MSINLCQSPLWDDIFRSKQSVIYMDNFSLFGCTLLVCKAKIYHLQLYLQVSKMIPICVLIYSSLSHYWCFFGVCKLLSVWTLLVTGAEPKAGTGVKMQTVRFFNVTLLGVYRCLRYIAGSLKSYPPFWKERGMEDSQEKDYSFCRSPTFTMH